MTERFERAYNALLKAFMNDTLAKGTCVACAVGNIVADAMGGQVMCSTFSEGTIKGLDYECNVRNSWWSDLFVTNIFGRQTIYTKKEGRYVEKYRKDIFKLTGYKWDEMAKVEKAFETNTKILYVEYPTHTEQQIMEDQFNGLMAVMDVLIKLDDVAEGQKYKDAFKTKLQLV